MRNEQDLYDFPNEYACPICLNEDLSETSVMYVSETVARCRKCYCRFGTVVDYEMYGGKKFRYSFIEETT